MKLKILVNVLFGQASISGNVANVGVLLLRLYAGFTIMMAGLDKLPVSEWLIEQVITFGFPFPALFAWLTSFSEFAFGVLLIIGLNTRVSAFILSIVLGVASFGFHQVLPFLNMHITQHFFWVFILFVIIGAGKFSLDYPVLKSSTTSLSKLSLISIPVFLILLIISFSRGFFLESKANEETVDITSINLPGSFNDWNPSIVEMQASPDSNYTINVDFEKSGLIEFKFTANKSWDINWGEEDQTSAGFPIRGTAEIDEGGNTENIRAYIPKPGKYQLHFDLKTFNYLLDTLKTP